MEGADAAEGFVVGARCCFDGYYATTRFVGEVPPAKGVWVGVEWDDVSRGKHSGDHEGTQYFTCSKPGSGSFVRPRKVTLGYSFIEALIKRYAETSAETERGGGGGGGGGKGEKDMFVISRNNLVTPVEMVGADMINKKTSQLTKLGSVSTSLRGMLVSSVGPPGEISTVAPNIQELDMSINHLLSSWETVAGICSQLTHLHSLNLSENFALSVPGDPHTLTPAFRQVKELAMNKMQLSWSQVCVVVSMFPGLERFHCCKNLISEISSQPPLQSLRLITLEENHLSSWDSVFRLASLPRLEILILNDNQIPHIFSSETADGRSPGFLELKSLSICRNRIHDWSSIIALNSMPALRELKIKGNPLFEGESGLNSRELVIAQLPRLQGLNGSPVTERERVVAERYYLTRFSSLWAESRAGTEEKRREFEAAHPRFSKLAETHNIALEALNSSKSTGSLLKDTLLSVEIRCPDHPEARQLSKRLPGCMTVQQLKGLLRRVHKVDSSRQRLSYLDSSRNIEIEMDDDLKQLSFFAIESGDTILLRW